MIDGTDIQINKIKQLLELNKKITKNNQTKKIILFEFLLSVLEISLFILKQMNRTLK